MSRHKKRGITKKKPKNLVKLRKSYNKEIASIEKRLNTKFPADQIPRLKDRKNQLRILEKELHKKIQKEKLKELDKVMKKRENID